MDTLEQESESPDTPSKSQKKRDMIALQKLGAELVGLSSDQLKKMGLPERLYEAVRDAQRITAHEAKRRQLQFIGKIMRDVDPEPIREVLDEIKGVSSTAIARQHALEGLRTRLMENEDALGDIARDYPGADLQYLRQLRRNALKEAEKGKPPRAYRELFRQLRELTRPAGNGDDADVEDFDAGDDSTDA